MNKFYDNPKQPASFSGVNKICHALKGKVKRKDVSKWLESKDSYTLHKSVRKKFPKNRVIVGEINQQFQADLVDMQSLSQHNDGYKYLLTCIDVLSKYAWAIPLKDKRANSIISAFEKIFRERRPLQLQTDAGTEFTNKLLQNFLRKNKVGFFTTNNKTKASIAERFNRTLKMKMWKYFTEKNTYRYIDIVKNLVFSYNHTWHRSIQIEPALVTEENQEVVWKTLYSDFSAKKVKPKFKPGDTVRISKEKLLFEKGYEQNWTIEIFTIDSIIRRDPVVYKIKDLSGKLIEGTFYEYEIQKVTDSGYYPVEKVLKTRRKNGITEYFVKFQGYPNDFNMWVTDMKAL